MLKGQILIEVIICIGRGFTHIKEEITKCRTKQLYARIVVQISFLHKTNRTFTRRKDSKTNLSDVLIADPQERDNQEEEISVVSAQCTRQYVPSAEYRQPFLLSQAVTSLCIARNAISHADNH